LPKILTGKKSRFQPLRWLHRQQKFWEKTQSALQNALNAHISKKTLVNEIRQIMFQNKDSIIQGMVAGGSDVFTSEQTFEQDIYRMLNTVNL